MADEGGERSAWRLWAVPVLLTALCAAVRLCALDADPPTWLSWSRGLYTDEGFYSLDARHHVLFGGWAPGNFHDRYVSPLLTALQIAVFRVGGVTRISARLVSVLCSFVTLALFWVLLNWRGGPRAANAGLAFLGLVPAFALYNRLALQETPAAMLLTLSLFCVAAAERYRRYSMVLWACAGIAAFSVAGAKSLGLFAVPGLIAAGIADGRRLNTCGYSTVGSKTVAVVLGLVLTAILYGVFWWLPHHHDLARMNRYYLTHQVLPHSPSTVLINIERFATGLDRGTMPFLVAFAGVPLALCLTRRKDLEPKAADMFACGWLIVGLVALAVMNYAPSRYLVLLLPPLCYLAALRYCALGPRWQMMAMVAFIVISGFWYIGYSAAMTFTEEMASRRLAAAFPQGSLLLGDMAPQLCLGTSLQAAPFQAGLSNDDRPLETLQPAGVLVGREPAWRSWWMSNAPEVLEPGNRMERVTIGGHGECIVDVYRVPAALKRATSDAGARKKR